jgi:hypothetical protein
VELDRQRNRSTEDYRGFPTVRDGVLPYVAFDPWRGDAPPVLTERRSLVGALRSVVREYRARSASTNGQCGRVLRTDIVPLLRANDRGATLTSGNTRRVL